MTLVASAYIEMIQRRFKIYVRLRAETFCSATQLFATAVPVAAVAPIVRQLCSNAHDTAEMQASANALPDGAVGAGTSGEANDALRYSYAGVYGR
jgi:hypothetical protein